MEDIDLQIKMISDELDDLDPSVFETHREYVDQKNSLNLQLNKLKQDKALSLNES
jgi:hypothetical protein